MDALTAAANESWESLFRAQVLLQRQFENEKIWGSLSLREYDVLYTLSKFPEGLSLSELNHQVMLSQPALSRMVSRLVEQGLVNSCTDPNSRRSVLITLTDNGKTKQRAIGRRHAASVTEALAAALNIDQMRELQSLCTRLIDTQKEN